jgi:hypothetical protein
VIDAGSLNIVNGIFIGQGNFGKNLLEIFTKATKINWIAFFGSEEYHNSIENIWSRIELSDFIVIACPDPFHIGWMQILSLNHYKGMIFCEKSPVVSPQQLEVLRKIDSEKIYFNFPLTFTKFMLPDLGDEPENKLLVIDWGHKFAFNPVYLTNWRSKFELVPYGIGTSLAIHFVHLALYLYGEINNFDVAYSNIAQTGTSPDSVKIFISFQSKTQVLINCSYAIEETQKLGTNHKEFFSFLNDKKIKQKPDINLDIDKNQTNFEDYLSFNSDPFIEGNVKSVNYFINCLRNNKNTNQDKKIVYKSLELLFT